MGEAGIIARLPFTGGEILLRADRTVQVLPSETLRETHREHASGADEQALKWGSSLIVGLAAIGAAAYMRGWRPVGWAAFGLSGLSGILARSIRKAARDWETVAFEPHSIDAIQMFIESDKTLHLSISGSANTPPWTVRLEAAEYDAVLAQHFLTTLTGLRRA